MNIKSPFRLPNPTEWRSIASAAFVALISFWFSARGFGFGSFLFLVIVLYALAFQFSEWRRVKYSLLALAFTLGILLSRIALPFPPLVVGLIAGVLVVLLFFSAAPRSDLWRTPQRIFGVALTFLVATLFFMDPTPLTFVGVAVSVALLTRDDARGLHALRVGEGKLIGAAVGLLGAEIAAFTGFLPLGPVRAGAFTALSLLMAREGLSEAYQGNFRGPLVFQGLAIFFALSVLLFASVTWVL